MASELTIRCDNRLSAVRSVSSPPAIGLSSEAMPVLCTLSAALNTSATVWLVARPVAVETGDALFACQLSQVGTTLVYSGSLSPSTVAAVAYLGSDASAEITVELVEVWTATGVTHRRTLAMFDTTILRSVYGGTYSDETIAQALTAVADCAAYANAITGLVAVEQAARIAGDEQLYDALESQLPTDALAKLISTASSSGRLWGFEIINEAGGYIRVAPGQGVSKTGTATLQDIPASLGDGQASPVELVTVATPTEVLLANGYNLIYWDASTGCLASCLRENFAANFDFVRDFTVGSVYYDESTGAKVFRQCGMSDWNFPRRVQMFGEERFPVERASGLMVGNPSGRTISMTEGVIWAGLVNRFPIAGFDSSTTGRFTTWAYSAPDGEPGIWESWYEADYLDATYYNNPSIPGGLGELTANRYGVHWIYVVHDSSVHVVYGTGDYTLAQAQNATPPARLPGLIAAYATLVGKAIIKKGAETLTSIQSPFTMNLGLATVNEHNDLGGLQGGSVGDYQHLTTAQVAAVNGAVRHDTAQALSAAAKAQACANVGLAAPVPCPFPEIVPIANCVITATSAKFATTSGGVQSGVHFLFRYVYSSGPTQEYPAYADVYARFNCAADGDTFTLLLLKETIQTMSVTVTRVSSTAYTIGSVTVTGSPTPLKIAFTNEGTAGNYVTKLYVNGVLAATSGTSGNKSNRLHFSTTSHNAYAWAAYLPNLNSWTL